MNPPETESKALATRERARTIDVSPEPKPVQEPEEDRRPRSVAVHAIWAGFLLCLAAAAVLMFRSFTEQARIGAEKVARGFGQVAEKFASGTINTTFQAEMPVFHSAGVGRLEVAASDPVTVKFLKTDERRIFWDILPLGQTVSEINVPVTFRYYVDLNEQWRVERDGHKCLVYPPPAKVTSPPAIHTDKMQKKTSSGWARFDKGENLEELERSITPELSKRAAYYFPHAREQSRLTVAKFIRAWLQREEKWTPEELNAIIVVFPDEVNNPAQPEPTLTTNSRH